MLYGFRHPLRSVTISRATTLLPIFCLLPYLLFQGECMEHSCCSSPPFPPLSLRFFKTAFIKPRSLLSSRQPLAAPEAYSFDLLFHTRPGCLQKSREVGCCVVGNDYLSVTDPGARGELQMSWCPHQGCTSCMGLFSSNRQPPPRLTFHTGHFSLTLTQRCMLVRLFHSTDGKSKSSGDRSPVNGKIR